MKRYSATYILSYDEPFRRYLKY